MNLVQMTKKEQKAYDRRKNREKFLRNLTLLKAKILKTKLDPNDTRTLQAHEDLEGNKRDYYVANPYLQTGESYNSIVPIIEDYEKHQFVYRGILSGADMATGVVEFDMPISEIVADPNANVEFQKMISKENVLSVCKKYWQKIGEDTEPLKGHTTYFGKPDFVLGTLSKSENGKYQYSYGIEQSVEEMLQKERKLENLVERLRNKDDVEINLGGGIVIPKQDCWMEQRNGIKFDGINEEALFYEYSPKQAPVKTEDGNYTYIGNLQIGKSSVINQNPNEPIQFIRPFICENVVLWTEGKNLIQYFLEKKMDGLNFVLGNIFTSSNVQSIDMNNLPVIIGGITLDDEGICKIAEKVPETVKKIVEQFSKPKRQVTSNKIINFEDYERE